MNEEIFILVILKVVNNDEKAIKEAVERAVNSAFKEKGTLMYEWSINGDELHVLERYESKEAVLTHIKNLANLTSELPKPWIASKFYVYGDVSDEIRKLLEHKNAIFMNKVGGFIR